MTVRNWWDEWDGYHSGIPPFSVLCNEDLTELNNPIGFIWFRKPTYRIKAIGRKLEINKRL